MLVKYAKVGCTANSHAATRAVFRSSTISAILYKVTTLTSDRAIWTNLIDQNSPKTLFMSASAYGYPGAASQPFEVRLSPSPSMMPVASIR